MGKVTNARTRRGGSQKEILLSLDEIVLYETKESQENWLKMIQVIQPLIGQIMQLQAQGMNPAPLVNILKETINRFDDRLEVDEFIPAVQPMQQVVQSQGV